MPRYRSTSGTMSLGFPPFRGMVKWLVLVNCGIYLLQAFLNIAHVVPEGVVFAVFGLIPAAVVHGIVNYGGGVYGGFWQVFTYLFIHHDVFHVLFNMLTLWMLGAMLESDWGTKRFREFYFYCGIAAALVTVAVSYTGAFGLSPTIPTVGASGAIYGILIAFGMLYGDMEMFLFPLPITIKAKYLVAIWIFITLAVTFSGPAGGVATIAHLGGLVFGWLYVKYLPRRGLGFIFSERYYGIRNQYFRWKRQRAARKFEVYMRKHHDDPQRHYFDEHGNYRGDAPSRSERDDDKPWMN
jgi:membrane associated rhomboid family serine protease